MNTFSAGLPHGTRARRNSIVALALASTALVALAAQPSIAAGAVPTGGAFAAGAGTIAATSNGLAINQTSARGIITWQSFSIGAGQLVQFNNGAGATLNRVTGTDISTIAGTLRATGSVFLVNPYGVIVAPGGQVITTGSFVASTRDIANTAFMQGGALEFQGTSAGTVVNQGTIMSSEGDVFLIGRSVENDGEISAANGTAGLAAGDDVLIQPANGDQRIFISVGGGDATNTGTIAAAEAELNAAGGNVYALAGNNDGLVSATGTTTVNGHVWLTAGQNIEVSGTVSAKNADGSGGEVDMVAGSSSGTLTVSGTVDASSANGNGGTVTMTAADVSLTGGAAVNADGATNGGIVLIGGDRGGGSDPSLDLSATPIADAQQTSIAAGAQIMADAGSGNGGSVVVWSQQETDFAGSIGAQGGAGASGGFAEVSSYELLGFTGTVDLLASGGTTGTLLLDPANVTISTSATNNDSLSSGTYSPSSGAATSNILNTDLETALASSSVTVTTTNNGTSGGAAGNITVTAPITWSNGSSLTLTAAGALNIENVITHGGSTAATVSLSSSGTTTLNITGAGQVDLLSNDTLKMGGTTFTLISALSSMGSASGDYALLTNLTGISLTTPVIAGATFAGIFDGLGHTISGSLTDNSGSTKVGLFSTNDGVIRNIGLTNWSVSSSINSADVGGLSGFNSNIILNAYISGTGTISSTASTMSCNCGIGGLVGYNSTVSPSTIISSYATENISAAANAASGDKLGIGGLVGYDNGGTVKSSYASGTVSDSAGGSGTYAGGFIGYAATGAIEADFALGTVGTCASCNVGQFLGGSVTAYTNDAATLTAAANTKTYDGTTSATATPTVTSGSLDSGDTLTGTESYTSADAGTGLTLSVSPGFSISYGSSSTNYYYSITTVNSTTGVINEAPLTVTPNAVSTTYSGSALSNTTYSDNTANYSIAGFVAGQTLSSTGIGLSGSMAFNGSTSTMVENAGTYTQSAGTLALSGTSNYSLSFSNTTPNNYVIAPAVLTVTPNAVSTTYSGSALNNTTYSDNTTNYSITGFVAGQTASSANVTLSGSMAFDGSTSTVVENVGTYSQSAGTLTLGSANSNYTMNFTNPAPNNYVITPAGISVVLSGSEVYDGSATIADVTAIATPPSITNLSVGDIATVSGSLTLAGKDVGVETITSFSGLTLGGTDASNYTLSGATGSVTITAAPLTVAAAANSKTYDGGTTAATLPTITAGTLYGTDTADFSESYASKNVGSNITLTPTGTVNDGDSGQDYSVTFVAANSGTISQAALTLTAATNSKTYDGTTAASAAPTITGLQGTDTVTNLGEAYTTANAGTGLTLGVSAGYVVNDGDGGNDYTVTLVPNTTSVIAAAPLTVTAAANSKTYDATTAAAATPTITAGTLYGSNTADFSESYASKNVGGTITLMPAGTVKDGDGGQDYSITFVSANTGVITAAPLTVTAAANSKTYDATTAAAATPTITAGTLYGTDTADFSESYVSKNVGSTITLTPTGTVNDGDGGQDYSVTFVAANSGTINPALLTVTAAANSMTYDGGTTAATLPTITAGTLYGTDTADFNESYASKNVGSTITLTPTGTVNDGDSGQDYSVTFVAANSGTISQAALTLTAATNSKTYDGTTAASAAPTITGLQGTDTVTNLGEAYTTANAGTGLTLGVSAGYVVNDGDGGNDYTVTLVPNTTSVIAAAPLTVTPNAVSTTYDAVALNTTSYSENTANYTITGFVAGQTLGSTGIGLTGALAFDGSAATTVESAGTYTQGQGTLALSGTTNYALAFSNSAPNDYVIAPKALTVSGLAVASKVYDGTNAATLSGTGSLGSAETPGAGTGTDGLPYTSDSVTLAGSAAGTFAQANVGTGITVNLSSSLSLTGANALDYTLVAPTSLTANITAAPLTITADSTSKTYGQTVTFAGTEFMTSGLVGSDSVGSVTLTSAGAAATAGVTGSPYAIAPSSAAGSGLGNYTISYVNGELTVNPLAVVLGGTEVYNATTSVSASSLTVSNLIGSDSVTLSGSATLSGANVGAEAITGTALSLNGSSAADYTLTGASGSVTVTAKALTVSGLSAANKVYDGTTDATLSGTGSLGSAETPGAGTGTDGLPYTGDSVTLAGSAAGTFAQANVGTGITVNLSSSLGLTGANAFDYTLVAPTSLTANITAAPLTITADSTSKTYGQTVTFAGTEFTISGLLGSDSVGSVTLTSAGAAATAAVTGSPYAIVPSSAAGSGLGNYTITYDNGSLTVNPLPVSLSGSEIYNGSTTAPAAAGAAFGLSIANLVGSDAVTLSGSATLAGADAGTETIASLDGLTLGGSAATNYTLTGGSGSVTVHPLPISLSGSATYDGSTGVEASILSVANLVAGDTLSLSGSATLASKNAGAEAIASLADLTLGGASASNYTLTGASGSVTVSPLTVSLGGSDIYSGTTSAAASGLTVANLVAGDTVTLSGAATIAGANVGAEAITGATGLALGGASAADYTLTGASGSVTISPAPLTITADNETMVVGASSLPALGIGFTGFVGGDTSSVLSPEPVALTTATPTSPIGTYSITVSSTGDPNYVIAYVPGTLSIVSELPPTAPPTPSTPSAASIVVSTEPPITNVTFSPTVTTVTSPPVVASLGNFSLDILAQQFNAIAPAAGGGTAPAEFTPQHPGLNVACAASGDAKLTITCTQ